MNYWTKVNPKGYKVLKKIISQDEVFEIRKNLDSFFSGYPKKRMLNLEDSIKEVGSIENISNQGYRPFASGISGPGTNLIFAIRYQK